MVRWFWWCWIVVGCGSQDLQEAPLATADSSTTGPPDSACGDVTDGYEVQILGRVTLGGKPVAGARVTIEEHTWEPGTVHGDGVTGEKGEFDVLATELVSVEGCWGLMLDYTAEVSAAGFGGSRNLNSALLGALTAGDGVADIRPLPIELEVSTEQTDTGY